ncbi:MAG: tetratricopeptide repeat protein [Planctomycetota bacterium]|jgi:tetratricopeptide (TPR) repeat protein
MDIRPHLGSLDRTSIRQRELNRAEPGPSASSADDGDSTSTRTDLRFDSATLRGFVETRCTEQRPVLSERPQPALSWRMPRGAVVHRRRPHLHLVLCLTLAAGVQAESASPLPTGSAPYYTGQGNIALMNQQFDSAISLFSQALEVDQSYYFALYNLALAHQQAARISSDADVRIRHHNEARRRYSEALQHQPDSTEALNNLGILAFEMGEYASAATHFDKAAELAGTATEVAEYLFNLGTAEEASGNDDAAGIAYHRASELDPDHFDAHYNLGTLYLRRLNDPTQAEHHLQRARELEPRRCEPLLNLAVLAEQRGQLAAADQFYSEAVRLAEVHQVDLETTTRWHRAGFYWRADLGDKPAKLVMKDDLLTILEHNPDFPEANGLLGRYYESIAEYGQAIHYLEREVAGANFDPSNSNDATAHFLLANIYSEHLKNSAKALEHISAYYELNPDHGNALRHRILRLDERGTP